MAKWREPEPKWVTVPDIEVRHVWTGDSDKDVYVSPDWYEENGTPVDPDTGDDMSYVRTEILRKI